MRIIIIGNNRYECIELKLSELKKTFFVTRAQLYYMPTDAVVKLHLNDQYGNRYDDEALIFYENIPYPIVANIPRERFDDNRLAALIDLEKNAVPKWKKTGLLAKVGAAWSAIAAGIIPVVIGVFIAVAFIQGMF